MIQEVNKLGEEVFLGVTSMRDFKVNSTIIDDTFIMLSELAKEFTDDNFNFKPIKWFHFGRLLRIANIVLRYYKKIKK